ncbi:MAG: 3-phosphoglycerate dehydrogenase [Clostridia bacterium]|nr:3-phosphoglycerate dehydrogenase [Clostridia bacterium]MBR2908522.1 3-phosphoglycerate dehydrogenase [Clostridia bacterium]
MKNVLCLNKISPIGLNKLDSAEYNVGTDVQNADAILVRSAAMHDMEFPKELLCIARAGAGVNNIPIDRCTKDGVVVFNTPGANANAVKELAICALMLASRKIVDGSIWAQGLAGTEGVAKAVEAGKSQFGGVEVMGKKLGVIGLGAIGGLVANAAIHLGMDVIGCDPYLSVDAAWNINHRVHKAATFEEVFREADYITLHVPATETTKGMINKESLGLMKDGVRVINLARADLVNAEDMKAALASGKVASYVTDFPTEDILGVPGVVAIPHLGASSEEAEDNCAVMAAQELDDYVRYGNIKNSVNFPNVSMPFSGDHRICVLHANIPAVISALTTILSGFGVNIENMTSKSKGDNAYTVIDVTGTIRPEAVAPISAIKGVYKCRVI